MPRSLKITYSAAILALGISIILLTHTRAATIEDLQFCMHMPWGDAKLSCVRENVQELLLMMPAHEIMRRVEMVYPDQCHMIGHVVGQEVFVRSTNGEEAFAACQPASCVHSCTHGVIGQAFLSVPGIRLSTEELQHADENLILSEAHLLCSDTTTCHAVGHEFFLLSNDLARSLVLCDKLTIDRPSTCYSGVFMENGARTFAITTPGSKEYGNIRDPSDLLSPCSAVASQYQPACFRFLYSNQRASFQELGVTDPREMFAMAAFACRSVQISENRSACFKSTAWLMQETGVAIDDARKLCSEFPLTDRAACLFGMSDAYGDQGTKTAEILRQCLLVTADSKPACYQGLFSELSDRKSGLLERACEGSFDSSCYEALQVFLSLQSASRPINTK